jgi:hypothetical protein
MEDEFPKFSSGDRVVVRKLFGVGDRVLGQLTIVGCGRSVSNRVSVGGGATGVVVQPVYDVGDDGRNGMFWRSLLGFAFMVQLDVDEGINPQMVVAFESELEAEPKPEQAPGLPVFRTGDKVVFVGFKGSPTEQQYERMEAAKRLTLEGAHWRENNYPALLGRVGVVESTFPHPATDAYRVILQDAYVVIPALAEELRPASGVDAPQETPASAEAPTSDVMAPTQAEEVPASAHPSTPEHLRVLLRQGGLWETDSETAGAIALLALALLHIFPNGERAVEVLGENADERDRSIVRNVVPLLRELLKRHPVELCERVERKVNRRLDRVRALELETEALRRKNERDLERLLRKVPDFRVDTYVAETDPTLADEVVVLPTALFEIEESAEAEGA